MSKQEQLIEFIIQDILYFLQKEKGLNWKQAMHVFYPSQTFAKLNDPQTGLYIESPAYIYEILSDELKEGSLRQHEI